MQVKKFEAPSLEQALALVKSELGPNALILSTQNKRGKWFQKSLVEVTAAFEKRVKDEILETFDEAELAQVFPHRKRGGGYEEKRPEPPESPKGPRPCRAVAHYAEADVAVASELPRPKKYDGNRFEGGFLRRGFGPDSARELSRRMVFDYPSKDLVNPAFLEKTRAKLVAGNLRTLGTEIFQERSGWVAIGTAGSGKTSLLVKLALSLRGRGLSVSLVGADKRKLAARTELTSYARLIGVPYAGDNVLGRPPETLQLVDSPSFSPNEEESLRRLETLINGRQCFLVLDAGQRLNELLRVVDKARRLSPVGIAFTRLDMVSELGVIHDLLKATKLPLIGVSLSASFTTPFRFFEPIDLARLLLNQNEEP